MIKAKNFPSLDMWLKEQRHVKILQGYNGILVNAYKNEEKVRHGARYQRI